MPLLEFVFKILLLAGPPLGALIGIHRAKTFWPLISFTLAGATITVINLRFAAQLSQLKAAPSPANDPPSGEIYYLASWLLAIVILVFGLHKIHRLRIQQAVAELLKDEE